MSGKVTSAEPYKERVSLARLVSADAAPAAMTPHTFRCMGTEIAVWIDHGDAALRGELYAMVEESLRAFEHRLTRFDAGSELSQVNAAPEWVVGVSREFADWLSAALWAAEWTGGLVDPTLADDIERAGYRHSLAPGAGPPAGAAGQPATLAEALAAPHTTAPASPASPARWRDVIVDRSSLAVTRPPGLRLDPGGTGKGFAADLVANLLARRLAAGTRWWLDCGGDMRLSKLFDSGQSHEVRVEDPFTGDHSHQMLLWGGAVATSTIGRRVWRNGDGSYGHHLLDPSTGRPAWTGLISVTAVGTSALQAETLAKWALLAGTEDARVLLADRGGLIVRDDGDVETVVPTASKNSQETANRKEAA